MGAPQIKKLKLSRKSKLNQICKEAWVCFRHKAPSADFPSNAQQYIINPQPLLISYKNNEYKDYCIKKVIHIYYMLIVLLYIQPRYMHEFLWVSWRRSFFFLHKPCFVLDVDWMLKCKYYTTSFWSVRFYNLSSWNINVSLFN